MKILLWNLDNRNYEVISIMGKRTEKRFTLIESAKRSGIGKSMLNNIENGKVVLSSPHFHKS